MTSTTPAERVRLTISVTPDVHAAYARLAKASGSSIGREMGEWLASTLDAVQFTASKIEQAREAPEVVMRDLNAYAAGLQGDLAGLLAAMGGGHSVPGSTALVVAPGGSCPPSSNTGGKVPRVNPKAIGKGDANPKRRAPALSQKKGS